MRMGRFFQVEIDETVIIGRDKAPRHKHVGTFPHHKHVGDRLKILKNRISKTYCAS